MVRSGRSGSKAGISMRDQEVVGSKRRLRWERAWRPEDGRWAVGVMGHPRVGTLDRVQFGCQEEVW